MPTLGIPYTFQNGQVADGAHVSANFQAVKDIVDPIVSNATHTGDVSGDTVLTIGSGKVVEGMIGAAAVSAAKLAADIDTKVLIAGAIYETDASIDWSLGATQKITLSGPTTFTFTGGTPGQVYRLIISAGGYSVTWPTIKWADGTAPTLTTTASKADIVTLLYDGTSYYASATMNF